MRLLSTAGFLWREALDNAASNNQQAVERALKCLYAGLELVLPTAIEVSFRLLLARILQLHTNNRIEACEHIRKSLKLVNSVVPDQCLTL